MPDYWAIQSIKGVIVPDTNPEEVAIELIALDPGGNLKVIQKDITALADAAAVLEDEALAAGGTFVAP